jgi:hypothetical protein
MCAEAAALSHRDELARCEALDRSALPPVRLELRHQYLALLQNARELRAELGGSDAAKRCAATSTGFVSSEKSRWSIWYCPRGTLGKQDLYTLAAMRPHLLEEGSLERHDGRGQVGQVSGRLRLVQVAQLGRAVRPSTHAPARACARERYRVRAVARRRATRRYLLAHFGLEE